MIRPHARAAVDEGLAVLARYLDGSLADRAFVDAFDSHVYTHALDGHEDPEGPIAHDELQRTLSLRVLFDVQRVIDRLFPDDEPNRELYRASGRILIAELRGEVLLAVSRAAIAVALDS